MRNIKVTLSLSLLSIYIVACSDPGKKIKTKCWLACTNYIRWKIKILPVYGMKINGQKEEKVI